MDYVCEVAKHLFLCLKPRFYLEKVILIEIMSRIMLCHHGIHGSTEQPFHCSMEVLSIAHQLYRARNSRLVTNTVGYLISGLEVKYTHETEGTGLSPMSVNGLHSLPMVHDGSVHKLK